MNVLRKIFNEFMFTVWMIKNHIVTTTNSLMWTTVDINDSLCVLQFSTISSVLFCMSVGNSHVLTYTFILQSATLRWWWKEVLHVHSSHSLHTPVTIILNFCLDGVHKTFCFKLECPSLASNFFPGTSMIEVCSQFNINHKQNII